MGDFNSQLRPSGQTSRATHRDPAYGSLLQISLIRKGVTVGLVKERGSLA
ncbi:MAG: hypothetical protein JXA22_02770 [Candidatus Thermoplasmatota archaeon]|nr:hypothetical protein [Candidatus Thermoplasmatota archaeon]